MAIPETESRRGLRRRKAIARRRAERRAGGSRALPDRTGPNWELLIPSLLGVSLASYLTITAWRDGTPLASLVAARGPLATVAELVVVTARPELVADALVARAATGRIPALVAVDAPTYAGRPATGPSPALLRLAAAGVPVAVLRHGVSLPNVLSGLKERAVG